MTAMISQALATDGTWTLVANSPIATVLVTGLANEWDVLIAASQPGQAVNGMRVGGDGTFTASALANGENVYARPAGNRAGRAMTVTGMYG